MVQLIIPTVFEFTEVMRCNAFIGFGWGFFCIKHIPVKSFLVFSLAYSGTLYLCSNSDTALFHVSVL